MQIIIRHKSISTWYCSVLTTRKWSPASAPFPASPPPVLRLFVYYTAQNVMKTFPQKITFPKISCKSSFISKLLKFGDFLVFVALLY